MSRIALLVAGALVSLPLLAQDALNMQAGLWEMKTTKMVMDGVDNSAKMAQAAAQMQAAMANMSPDQRAKIESMMHMSSDGSMMSIRFCRTADQVKDHTIPTGQNGKCQSNYSPSGSGFSFSYNCPTGNGTTSGKGTIARSGDTVSMVNDGTVTDSKGTHTMHIEMQWSYLGSDCGSVKPIGATN